MASNEMTDWNSATEDHRIGFTAGERSYPIKRTPTKPPGKELELPPLSNFAQGIVEQLRREMEFFKKQGTWLSYDDLLPDFTAGVELVQRAVAETRTFIRKIAETNIAVEQKGFHHNELRAQTYRKACREFVENSKLWDNLPFPSISARREVSRTMTEHEVEHAQELETLIREFALLVEYELDRLVAQQLVGIVEWGTDTSCDFHFFNTVVLQRAKKKYKVQRELNSRVVHDNELFTERETAIEEQQHIRGESEYRHARSNIYLREATVRPIEHVRHRIPDKFAELGRAVPSFLCGATTLIEGVRCSEELLVGTKKKEGFDIKDGPAKILYRTTVTPKPELEYRRIQRHYDPAIVIGNHYVVTGWGPEEEAAHADEKSEQRAASVRDQEAAHLRDWRNATIFGGVASAILGLLFVLYCQYNPQLMLPLCALTAIGSISLLGFSQRIGALAEGDESWEPALLAIALSSSGIVGVYFITFGFVAGSTLYGLLGGLAFVIAVAMTTFRHHMLTSK